MGRSIDKILSELSVDLSDIIELFRKTIYIINKEWLFREHFKIDKTLLDEEKIKGITFTIKIYNTPNPNEENLLKVRFSRYGICFRNSWMKDCFDFTLWVELDLTEANIKGGLLKEEVTKEAHRKYFTFEELTILDSAVAIAVNTIAESGGYDYYKVKRKLDL